MEKYEGVYGYDRYESLIVSVRRDSRSDVKVIPSLIHYGIY